MFAHFFEWFLGWFWDGFWSHFGPQNLWKKQSKICRLFYWFFDRFWMHFGKCFVDFLSMFDSFFEYLWSMFCGPVIFPRHGGGDGRRQLDPAPPKGCCCVESNSWTFWIVHTCQYWQLRLTPRPAPPRAFARTFLLCWPQDGSKLDFLASLDHMFDHIDQILHHFG